MSEASPRHGKTFTVEEANASLPLVRAITSDLVRLSRDLTERRHRLESLMRGRRASAGDPYSDELAQIQEEYEKDRLQLDEFTQELLELGVELKSAPEGLIDFPAEMDGRPVYLCWRYNEPEVLFWHELEAGFAGRQPLTVGSLSSGDHETDEGLYGTSP